MSTLTTQVAAVRRFNRFYTKQIGALHEGLLDSPFSLTEVRVLYELAHRDGVTATDLGAALDLDAGYLSRILKRFEAKRYVSRASALEDRRRRLLRLTPAGRHAFEPLDKRSQQQVRAMLGKLGADRQQHVLDAMAAIHDAFAGAGPGGRGPVVLRRHRPGDIGWVVQRHGELYAREYGWDERFEALVAEIAAKFIHDYDPARERCWIAERDGRRLGCVFLVSKSKTIAKLRMLLVEPDARGLGLGKRLVDECVAYAREAGYRKIQLWTQSNLDAARHIYASVGFRKIAAEPHRSFGHDLVAETWELSL